MKYGQEVRLGLLKGWITNIKCYLIMLLSRLKKWFFTVVVLISAVGCKDECAENVVAFIGDSLVSRWDTDYYFTSYTTYNYGVGGSGIKLIEQNKGNFTGQTVVILTGTNDIKLIVGDSELDDYVNRYVNAIVQLKAKKIILISVLPKNLDYEKSNDINGLIRAFNKRIESNVSRIDFIVYCDVFEDFLLNGEMNMNLSFDGVHLNQFGYEILTENVKRFI